MFRSPQDPSRGSDRERIRWDAVKLAADLLTVEDRLMVQRFNHTCPPDYVNKEGQIYAFFDPDAKQPLRSAEDDFPTRFVNLSGRERSDLEARIALFNTTTDWQGRLDQGETGIINALQVIARRLGRPTPGRQTHIVLLTDGVDSNHQVYAAAESLRQALRAYTGDLPGHDPIPIHTIGLGLTGGAFSSTPSEAAGRDASTNVCSPVSAGGALPLAEGKQAESFLVRIAALTGGSYYPAETNRDLIRIFLALIRDLKGAWFQHQRFDPAQGQLREIGPTPVRGAVDLGVLAFEVDPQAAGAKSTFPLSQPLGIEWIGLGSQRAPETARRTGKSGTVYEYHYVGKGTRDETDKSPFADLPPSARVVLSAKGSNRPQEVILVKKTQEALFAMVRPEEGAKFHRNQALDVELLMAESAFFHPDQFEVTARLMCAGEGSHASGAEPVAEIAIPPVPQSRRFAGAFALGKLPPSSAPFDYYTLAVTVRGKPQADNTLGGFQLDLPPRTIAVDNTLVFEPVAPVELTTEQPRAVVGLSAAFPVLDDLTLQAKFLPFQRDGAPVELNDFVFASGGGDIAAGGLPLRQGKASISLGFRRGAVLPEGGVVYQPGKIVVTGGEGVRMAPLEIEVRLRLALAKVAVEPPELQLLAEPMPVGSVVAKVQLTPPDQPKTGVGRIRLEIRRPEGETGGPAFTAEELWLQEAGPPVAAAQRMQTLSVDLGGGFQVYLHPRGAKEPGKYAYEVAASGRGIDEAVAPVVLSIDAPKLEAREPKLTVAADPGVMATADFEVRVSGLAATPQPAYLLQSESKQTLQFHNLEPSGQSNPLDLQAEFPDEFEPVQLPPPAAGQETPWTTFPIRVEVPPETPYGRYRAQLTVTSPQASELPLTLELVVNSLLIDVPATLDDGAPSWRKTDEAPVLQFFGRPVSKTMRVRTGIGEPLLPEQIEVTPLRPFADEAGDAMRLPKVASIAPAKEGGDLLVTLEFPETGNAHADLPYRIQVEVRSPELQLKPATLAFRVRFWNPLDFFDAEPQ